MCKIIYCAFVCLVYGFFLLVLFNLCEVCVFWTISFILLFLRFSMFFSEFFMDHSSIHYWSRGCAGASASLLRRGSFSNIFWGCVFIKLVDNFSFLQNWTRYNQTNYTIFHVNCFFFPS